MSVSGIPANPANLDKFEPRLLARGARQASAEDLLLFELARKLAPVRSSPHPQAASAPGHTDNEPMRPFEAARGERKGTASVGDGRSTIPDLTIAIRTIRMRLAHRRNDARQAGLARLRRSPRPARRCLAPLSSIAAFGPKEGSPGLPTAPHFIAAGQGATQAPQQGGETVAIRSDPDVTPLKVIPPVEFVGSEQRRINFDAGSSPGVPLSSRRRLGAAQPAPGDVRWTARRGAGRGSADRCPASRRVAELPIPTPCVRRRRRRTRPRRPSATDARRSGAPRADPHRGPLIRRRATESKAATVARSTTPKLDSSAKLAGDRPPHIFARTEPATSGADRGDPAPAASSFGVGDPRAQAKPPAPTEPRAAPPAPAVSQEPVNPVTRAVGALAGALGAPAVDQTKPGDWGIQFATPKSEAEARIAVARLNAKYAPTLNGATIGVQKTLVNGETVYALRVAGLSKADAAALCVRLKGRDCSIANASGAEGAPPVPAALGGKVMRARRSATPCATSSLTGARGISLRRRALGDPFPHLVPPFQRRRRVDLEDRVAGALAYRHPKQLEPALVGDVLEADLAAVGGRNRLQRRLDRVTHQRVVSAR